LLDDAKSDVDDVAVGLQVVGAYHKHRAGEKVEDECVKTVGRMLIGGHLLPILFAILGLCFAVVVNKPREHIDKENILLVEAPLLEGRAHLQREGVKENIGEGGIHSHDVGSHLFIQGMLCLHCCVVVVVSTLRVVRHLINHRWEGSKVGWIRIGHEESVDFLGTGAKEKIHCGRRGRAVRLSTATEMK
jgi:hypothetical protein